MDVIRPKEYPENYPSDAIKILNAMSMGDNINLVGSMSLRSQQYAGDYDGYEVVKHKGKTSAFLIELRKRFQSNIKKLGDMKYVYIGNIKAGVVDEWRVIPKTAYVKDGIVVGYFAVKCRNKIRCLLEDGVINKTEARDALRLLKGRLSPIEFLNARDKLKFHILRWTAKDVLNNCLHYRGRSFTLEEAFPTPGLTKLDVVGFVQNNRFTDFSVIYEFRCNGEVLNPEPVNIKVSLIESIITYTAEGNYFKVLKRLFALYKFQHNTKMLEELNPILNSDLGRLYQIVSDMDTLLALLEYKSPIGVIRFEIDQFIHRLSTIYTLNSYLEKDDEIVESVRRIATLPNAKIKLALQKVRDELYDILQYNSKPYLKKFDYKDC
jgi:hypothetical protein